METDTVQTIKNLVAMIEAATKDRDLYRTMYRAEKDRADKLEATIKAKEDKF